MTNIANDVIPTEVLRYGAYICLSLPEQAREAVACTSVSGLADQLGFQNEFEPPEGGPGNSIAYLRRVEATPGNLADDDLLRADVVIHVASQSAPPVDEFCRQIEQLLRPTVKPIVLRGVKHPMSYTGAAMHNFAYARQVTQKSAKVMPNAFLVPMSKTPEWWAKSWLERHTYFLPRYDEDGRMLSQGHALAAAAGITCLLRRTYWNESLPAPDGSYDFINYFECADEDIPTFHSVCARLRDTRINPEWKFVREGPTWRARRIATWPELF